MEVSKSRKLIYFEDLPLTKFAMTCGYLLDPISAHACHVIQLTWSTTGQKHRQISQTVSECKLFIGGSGAKWVENFLHLFCFVRFLLRYMVTTPITDIATNITTMDIAITNPATIIIIIIITDIAMILKTNILMNILLENINKKQIPQIQAVILQPKNLLQLKPQTGNGQNGFRR